MCRVCGWSKSDPDALSKDYPGETARGHEVSRAHLMRTEDHCKALGVPFDKSNFLFLCGAQNEGPSCHCAFDNFHMCFIKGEGDAWRVRATKDP